MQEDAQDLFEDPEEKKMIALLMTNNFKADKKAFSKQNWFMYGLTPDEYESSTMNPATVFKQQAHINNSIPE